MSALNCVVFDLTTAYKTANSDAIAQALIDLGYNADGDKTDNKDARQAVKDCVRMMIEESDALDEMIQHLARWQLIPDPPIDGEATAKEARDIFDNEL